MFPAVWPLWVLQNTPCIAWGIPEKHRALLSLVRELGHFCPSDRSKVSGLFLVDFANAKSFPACFFALEERAWNSQKSWV